MQHLEGTTMTTRLLLAALLTSLPAALAAQSASNASAGVVRLPGALDSVVAAASGKLAAICDGSEMRRAQRLRWTGAALAGGSLVVSALATSAAFHNPPRDFEGGKALGRRTMTIAVGSLPFALAGGYLYTRSYPGESFWQRTLARMKIGETRSAQVRACLREPWATSVTTTFGSGAQEEWTYAWKRWGSLHSVRFTFKDSVLAEVRRSRATLPVEDSETRAIPLPLPDPTTTAGSPPPR
jgi:hypothetical protein